MVNNKDLVTLSKEEWEKLDELTVVLKPFEEATKTMSSEQYLTVSHVTPFAFYICNKKHKESFQALRAVRIIEILRKGFQD